LRKFRFREGPSEKREHASAGGKKKGASSNWVDRFHRGDGKRKEGRTYISGDLNAKALAGLKKKGLH